LKFDKLIPRNISLTILLIIVLVMVQLFRNRTPFGKDQTSFSAASQKEITRIELSGKGDKLTLEKKGDVWIVNGRNEARRSAISFIERILREIKIKSPVSPELFQHEVVSKEIYPVRVRVFDNNKLLTSFMVYKTRSNIYGNIMKTKEKSKPFIVCVPGYEGDIGSAFTLNELYWHPYMVFNLLPSEIQSVSFDNVADPSSSFTITGRNNVYTLSDGNTSLSGWDSSRIRRYISYFTLIPFESWALDLPKHQADSIQSTSPLYRINVRKSDGTGIMLSLWEKMDDETGEKDSDRLWGKTDSGNVLFIMRYFDIDPLLKKRSYFYVQ
jgi:hypothetical protein